MPYFNCRLVCIKTNQKINKEDYADTKEELSEKLLKDFVILEIKQIRKKRSLKLSNDDIMFFFSYILELLKIGINIQEALLIMSIESGSKNVKAFTQSVYENIKSGLNFSSAVKDSAPEINQFFISILSTGEGSNNLESSFEYIVNYIKVTKLIKSRTRKAIIYPSFLFIMISGMMVAASVFMIPKMMEFGKSMGIEASFSTILLQSFAGFLREKWYIILSTLVFLITSTILLSKFVPSFKKRLDWLKLKLPIVKTIIIKSNLAKFCIFFSIAYKSGTNIVDALSQSKNVITNDIIKNDINGISILVESGHLVSSAMEGTVIPSFVIRMFKIGESTGEIAKSLDNVVTFYTREIDNLSDNLIASIKPAGILIAGGMIIWIITATILPIYTQFIGKMM
jgi:type IV pilus assembly protein PilC